MTAIIVVFAMNIGQQLSKGVEKKSSGSSNTTSNSNSNVESNSNETTNCTSNEPQAKIYTNKDVAGMYIYDTNDYQYEIELYSNGLFSYDVDTKGPACGMTTRGNYYIDGNSITLNSLVAHSCDGQGDKSKSVTSAKISNENLILSENILTTGNQKNQQMSHIQNQKKSLMKKKQKIS